MALHLKRAYEGVQREDGFRVLVDRLWPRGITRERISIDLWLKSIAPSPELRIWFDHDPNKWLAFYTDYTNELLHNHNAVHQLVSHCRQGDVTLVYAAKDTVHTHAKV